MNESDVYFNNDQVEITTILIICNDTTVYRFNFFFNMNIIKYLNILELFKQKNFTNMEI